MTQPEPKAGITQIKPYVGGKSKSDGVTQTIKLSSNENPWGPSPRAVAAYGMAAGQLQRYPDGAHGTLREMIGRVHGLPPEQLICGAGSDELLGLLVHAYAGVGDEVLFTEHGFLMYRIYTLANGATPVTAAENNLTTDVDALLAKVTAKTKIVFLANPNNPTGTVIPFSEVKRLREALPPQVILGLDAAYAEYIDDPAYDAGASLVTAGTNSIMFRTFSKIYGLPAIRLGWAYAPPAMIDILNRVRSPFNVTAPALLAGLAAVEDQDYIAEMRMKNTQERVRVTEALQALGLQVIPSQTNFVLVKFGASAASANQYLMARGLIVREVGNYGLPEYLRISIGTTDENTQLLAALSDFSAQHAA